MISNFGNRPDVEVIYIWRRRRRSRRRKKGRRMRRRERVNDLTQKRKGRGRKC